MFCPQCTYEYREGFTRCPDCNVALVDQLPVEEQEPANPDLNFVKILETNDLTDIMQIKSALDAAEIRYFIQGETMKAMRPFDQPALLMVAEDDAERSMELLRDLKLSYMRMIFSGK